MSSQHQPEGTPPGGRGSLRTLKRMAPAIGIVVAGAGLVFVGRSLFAQREQTAALLQRAQWAWLGAALPVAMVAMTLIGLAWSAVMGSLGETRGTLQVLSWYFPGQLGKYVPGGFWPVVGRGELATRGGVGRATAYTSVALSLAFTYIAAALTALVMLGAAVLAGDDTGGGLWALLLLPAGLVLFHPRVLTRIISTMERMMAREFPVRVPAYRSILALIGIHIPAWLMIGGATWLVAKAFDSSPAVAGVMFAAVLSWVVGFVVIPVPGGLGVREAAFVAAAVGLGSDVAAATAITARLCFVIVDLLGSGAVMLLPVIRRTLRNDPEKPHRALPGDSSPEVSER